MKENSFYSDDFEELIRGKTEQYKMYPSENVWKGVHSALHTKRKWFIGSMAFLVTGILFMAGRELILPSNHPVLHKPMTGAAADAVKPAVENAPRAPLAILRPANTAVTARHNDSDNNTSSQEWDPSTAGISITVRHPVLSQSDLSEWLSQVVKLPAQAPDLDVIAARTPATDNNAIAAATRGSDEQRNTADEQRGVANDQRGTADDQRIAGDGRTTADGRIATDSRDGRIAGDGRVAGDSRNTGSETGTDGLTAQGVIESLSAKGAHEGYYARSGAALQSSTSTRSGVNGQSRLAESAGASTRASAREIAESDDAQRVNWLHDYAMNLLETTPKSGRTYLELSLSPTVSYRSMGGSDVGADKLYPLGVNGLPPGGPNSYIDHRPGFGFDASGSILYRLTRNLSVKGGLQFNFTRFPIKVYEDNGANGTAATTTLQSPYGIMMDSISATGMPMARSGKQTSITVDNDYYQLSAPMGFELRVLGNERLQFNLAATIAPSYLLNSSSYMLSSGYTRYDKRPTMYRKLNFYVGGEAFFSYRVGNIRWQIGPEFRYQLLSSYTSESGMTENLKSYGLKIGITKSIP
ncbi:MAG TPA: hypothetical protein VGS79_11995 [Puia sp.]|nr:hypothetical protein [Puia sp.]